MIGGLGYGMDGFTKFRKEGGSADNPRFLKECYFLSPEAQELAEDIIVTVPEQRCGLPAFPAVVRKAKRVDFARGDPQNGMFQFMEVMTGF